MATPGNPDPTFAAKVRLSGTTFDFDLKSDVIDDVNGDVVTLASDQSLAELNGEEVMMTEGDGALASYTLTTSEITNVVDLFNLSKEDRLDLQIHSKLQAI